MAKGHQEHIRFIKFMIVGLIGAIVDFAAMNVLVHAFSFSLTLAGSVSFICAVLSNFFWNRIWTYPDSRSKSLPRQLAMFFLVNIAGIGIRIPILHFLEPPLLAYLNQVGGFQGFSSLLARNLTLALAVGFVMLWNFFINRYWTYNDVDQVKI